MKTLTYIITESQESKSIDAAKKLLQKELGWDREEADRFIRNDLRNDLPALRNSTTAKFILGVTRMYVAKELKSASVINNLNASLIYASKAGTIDKWDRNLNGVSAKDLIKTFEPEVEADVKVKKDKINSVTYSGDSEYEIVKINSFEESSKYAKFTDWCITHDRDMFLSYSKDGINQFYFCLKNGYKKIQRTAESNAPLDTYGLSMLAVCVKPNGSLATCTCRWNHDQKGDDNVMDEEQISEVINKNFYETFIPNSLYKVFQDYDGFRKIEDGSEYYQVYKKSTDKPKYNIINIKTNKLLLDKWLENNSLGYPFDRTWNDGYILVRLYSKDLSKLSCNFVSKEGKFLSDEWFDFADKFKKGKAYIQTSEFKGYIDTKGKITYINFKVEGEFIHGFSVVKQNDKYNYIDTEYNLLSKTWFDRAGLFTEEGFAIVCLDKQENFIDKTGKILLKEWYHRVESFSSGIAKIYKDDTHVNCIDTTGKILFDLWYDSIGKFYDGWDITEVYRNLKKPHDFESGLFNFITRTGKLMLKDWVPGFIYNSIREKLCFLYEYNKMWYKINKNLEVCINRNWYKFEGDKTLQEHVPVKETFISLEQYIKENLE